MPKHLCSLLLLIAVAVELSCSSVAREAIDMKTLQPLLAVGAKAPAFVCTDSSGRMVKSADLAGKRYVLWFFPKADTPG